MKARHKSDSLEQRRAEPYMLKELGLAYPPKPPTLKRGTHVELDGYDPKRRILCEVFAHIGPLKSGQAHKVGNDILKMLLVEKELGGDWHKIYCFASEAAAEKLRGDSWLARAATQFCVKSKVVQLPARILASIRKAQHRQTR